jgi:hypothetical protein
LLLSDLMICKNVCWGALWKHSYTLCCNHISWKAFSHCPTEVVLASLIFQRLPSEWFLAHPHAYSIPSPANSQWHFGVQSMNRLISLVLS